ncbi:MAG: phosphoribosylformylglycinamidine synthase subunit PurS [Leptospira sp.]|nr:phosphoribosylformylglycinamidine synthase subunit PurS [Leptospira sp.]
MFIAKINVTLKESVLDPQGQTVLRVVKDQGKSQVKDLRVGKYIEVKLDVPTKAEAESLTKEICESILVNSVIESYRFSVETL